jgi:hypothetical protein
MTYRWGCWFKQINLISIIKDNQKTGCPFCLSD